MPTSRLRTGVAAMNRHLLAYAMSLAAGAALSVTPAAGHADRVPPPGAGYTEIGSRTTVVESLKADRESGQVVLMVRGSAGGTERIEVRPPAIPVGLARVARSLEWTGEEPRRGDVVRATGVTAVGGMRATAIEVRDGRPCVRCDSFADKAEGYRLWLVRVYYDLWEGGDRERMLLRVTAELFAQHASLHHSAPRLWLRGQMGDMLSYYLTPGGDAFVSRFGGPKVRETTSRVRRLVTEHETAQILMLGEPFVPASWSQVPVGTRWPCLPAAVYLVDGKPSRIL